MPSAPDVRSGLHDGTLGLNAFYATQQLFVKGYGNYLGLARLGMFVGGETGLKLTRVSCFVGVEKMDHKPKPGPELDALIQACDVALHGVAATEGALT